VLTSIFFTALRNIKSQWKFLGGLLLLQAVVYSFYFFGLVYTDHTMQNAFVQAYPRYRTTSEGRWLQDLLILGLGSTGTHNFQMLLASALQALNALLLIRVAGLRDLLPMVLCGALYCLYPAFLDYFGFQIDHVGFVLGDTLVLLGALGFIHLQGSWQRVVLPALAYTGALAIYQPKVSLVCLMAALALLACWSGQKSGERSPLRQSLIDILLALFSVSAALGLYRLSAALVIVQDARGFTQLNGPEQILSAIVESYPAFFQHFFGGVGGLPSWLSFLPLAAIFVGVTCLLRNLGMRNKPLMVLSLGVLAMIPLGLAASEIVNSKTSYSGRFVAANGICLVYFLALAFQLRVAKPIATAIAAILVYFYGILGLQRNTSAQFKAQWEWNFQNRVAARLETLAPVQAQPKPLVVIGEFQYTHHEKMVKYPPVYAKTQTFLRSFATYSQVPQLNFLLGRAAFRWPSAQEVAKALDSAKGRSPWPDAAGAYVVDGIVVLVLFPPYPGICTTVVGSQ
jgi:hypothetical protein